MTMKDTNESILVTVAICTYNNAIHILETLESIKLQSYEALELVVSDDASTDDTLAAVGHWAAQRENRDRFSRIEILKVAKNTGVSANANRALRAAKGSWIKYIAGDDALRPDCIRDNINWAKLNPDARVVFSRVEIYNETFESHNLIEISEDDSGNQCSLMAVGRNAGEQYQMLLMSDRIHYAPSAFLHRETLLTIGGYDEEFRLLEDYPLWLNLTKNGYKLYFMNEVTARYRRHSAAINNNNGLTRIVNPNFFKTESFRKKYTYPWLPVEVRLEQRYRWCASQIFRFDPLNRNTMAGRFLYNFLVHYTNPFRMFIKMKKLIHPRYKENIFYQ